MLVFETFKMRFTSLTVLLVSLVASIHAGVMPREADGVLESREGDQVISDIIKAYSDTSCEKAIETFIVFNGLWMGKMSLDTKAITADLDCDGTLNRTMIDVFAQICEVN